MKQYMVLKKNNTGIISELEKFIQDPHMENMYNPRFNYEGIFFKVVRKFNLPILTLLFGKWKDNIKDFEKVIFFDDGYNEKIAKYIKKHNPNCETNFFYWNNINDYNKRFLADKNLDKRWTFYEEDAKKYNIEYNSTFYTNNIKLEEKQKDVDVLFLGRNKNRKEEITRIENALKEKNFNVDFRIIENEKSLVAYPEYLKLLENSKCILDIVNDGKAGQTLRAMESIFLEKKLITNNKLISKFDFYNPNNIFIIRRR